MKDKETKVSLSWQAREFSRMSVVSTGYAFGLITIKLGDFLFKQYNEYLNGVAYEGFRQLTIQVLDWFIILFAVIFSLIQVRLWNIKLKIAKLEKEEGKND